MMVSPATPSRASKSPSWVTTGSPRDAAIAAILDGAEKVDRKLLDSIPTDHAAEEFRTRTPVKHDGAPTPLRRAE